MVLPLNNTSSVSFMLIYGQFLVANGAYTYVIAGIICMGIENNSMDGLVY